MLLINENKVPFFTVIICTYNREKLLPRALDSLRNQAFKDFEAVIVDDGSTDDTASLVTKYCREDARFRYIFHKNKGLSLSRNTGILASAGLFITFLDSDDEYTSDHLNSRHRILTSNDGIDLLHGGVQIMGNPYVPDANNENAQIHLNECVIGGTFFFRKSVALEINGFNAVFAEDKDFYDRILNAGFTVAKTQIDSYIYHRDTEDSICNKIMKKINH